MQNHPPPTGETLTSAGDHVAAADLCEPCVECGTSGDDLEVKCCKGCHRSTCNICTCFETCPRCQAELCDACFLKHLGSTCSSSSGHQADPPGKAADSEMHDNQSHSSAQLETEEAKEAIERVDLLLLEARCLRCPHALPRRQRSNGTERRSHRVRRISERWRATLSTPR